MGGIVRQSDQYDVFDDGQVRYAKEDRVESQIPLHVLADFAGGPRVGVGQLNPGNRRHAVDTHGMPPDSHAYHEPVGPGQGDPHPFRNERELAPWQEAEQERDLPGRDDESGYNWGPEPHGDEFGPGLSPDFHDGGPHPFGTPTYDPGGGYSDHPPSFSAARHYAAKDGPMPADIAEASGNEHLLDNEGTLWHEHPQHGWRYVTTDQSGSPSWGYDARERLPQEYEPYTIPHPAVADLARHVREGRRDFSAARRLADGGPELDGDEPELFTPMHFRERAPHLHPSMMLGKTSGFALDHMFLPGHRVGLPYHDSVIPGTVTHLRPDTQVGVRWDDGQHSIEAPGDVHHL